MILTLINGKKRTLFQPALVCAHDKFVILPPPNPLTPKMGEPLPCKMTNFFPLHCQFVKIAVHPLAFCRLEKTRIYCSGPKQLRLLFFDNLRWVAYKTRLLSLLRPIPPPYRKLQPPLQ